MEDISLKLAELVKGGLYPNLITFLTQLSATLILLYFLKRLVWKPMQNFLAERSDVIVGELESAKQARLDAEATREKYEIELKEAKNQATIILDSAKNQAIETKQQIIEEAEKEAAYKLSKAEKEIALERSKVEQELKSQVIDIALIAAEKLVQHSMDDSRNRQLIDKFINEVGE